MSLDYDHFKELYEPTFPTLLFKALIYYLVNTHHSQRNPLTISTSPTSTKTSFDTSCRVVVFAGRVVPVYFAFVTLIIFCVAALLYFHDCFNSQFFFINCSIVPQPNVWISVPSHYLCTGHCFDPQGAHVLRILRPFLKFAYSYGFFQVSMCCYQLGCFKVCLCAILSYLCAVSVLLLSHSVCHISRILFFRSCFGVLLFLCIQFLISISSAVPVDRSWYVW